MCRLHLRHKRGRLPLALMSALFALFPLIANAQVVASNPVGRHASPNAVKTIEIPEGTPVIVHFFNPQTLLEYNSKNDALNSAVLQVDSDVVIDGVLVIPAGSLGVAHVDSLNVDAHKVYDGNYFHMVSVFSIGSTQLTLDPSPVATTLRAAHHFSLIPSYPTQLTDRITTQYTAKLVHAIVTLPR